MADVTVVAADVRPLGDRNIIRRYTSGDTITAGQPVYLSAADTVSLADGSAASTSFAIGVALNGAASGEAVDVNQEGPVAGYSTNMAQNKLFYVDNDAGVIADATGTATTIIGIGLSASVLYVHPIWVSLS